MSDRIVKVKGHNSKLFKSSLLFQPGLDLDVASPCSHQSGLSRLADGKAEVFQNLIFTSSLLLS